VAALRPRRKRGGEFEAYVRRVLFTTHVSWWRRRKVQETAFITDVHDTEVQATRDSVLRITMLEALEELSTRQRAVIVLRFFEDLTEHETADVLNCSIGTVKTHQYRALRALRDSPALRPDGLAELL